MLHLIMFQSDVAILTLDRQIQMLSAVPHSGSELSIYYAVLVIL